MKKEWGLLPKILNGQKKIESRWYKSKHLPWGKIKAGDRIFFKNSGEAITVTARVDRVIQFENLSSEKVTEILNKYGRDDGIESEKFGYFYDLFRDKKYCLLIYLAKAERIEPFDINKKGFGAMAAWMTVENIKSIKSPVLR